jgi:hypothetical protein
MNFVPAGAAEAFLDGDLSWTGDAWRNVLLDGSVNQATAFGYTHRTDLASGAVISDVALTNPVLVNGGARTDAADHGTLAAQITRTIVRHWIYHDTSGLLVAHYDTSMFGAINRTIDGVTPIIVIPHPTGWFRFTNIE